MPGTKTLPWSAFPEYVLRNHYKKSRGSCKSRKTTEFTGTDLFSLVLFEETEPMEKPDSPIV